jgi:hypothetical protein
VLTTVQRNLAGLKLELLKEAATVPPAYIDTLNVAIAHLNDAASIIQGVCLQTEPESANLTSERVAEKAELAELREQIRELREGQRSQPDQPAESRPAPPKDIDVDQELIGGIDPDATGESLEAAVPDLIPVADPDHDTVRMGDPQAVAAEQARVAGRQTDERSREGDPPELGWG